MEVDGLGARCTLPACRHIDYLPISCPHCKSPFCQHHHLPSQHKCRSLPSPASIPVCPLCHTPVPPPPGTSPDVAVSRHIDQGCPKRKRSNPVCALPACNVRDIASTKCVACANVYCLSHRIESQHDCTGKRVVNGVFGNGVTATNTKKPPPRTDFLNTPSTATGDASILDENRITLAIFFPPASNLQPRFMYFSVKQSSGRIIDSLRKSFPKIPPPHGDRYYLYAVKQGVTGVNLLPYMTPLGELGGVLGGGGGIVLEVGDGGLKQEWISVLERHLNGGSSRRKKTFRGLSPRLKEKCQIA